MFPVVILAGGLATRLMPITETIPKALIDIAGRPFIEHQLILLKNQGIKKVVICTGHLGEKIKNHIGDGQKFGINIDYSEDGKYLLGTGGAIRNALNLLGDNFFVMYGDSYLLVNFSEVQKAYLKSEKKALMTVFGNKDRWDTSNVRFEGDRIREYNKEKPTKEMQHIDYGLGVLKSSIFSGYASDKTFDLAEIYNKLSLMDDLAGFEVTKRFYEIGSHNGLAETEEFLLKENKHDLC